MKFNGKTYDDRHGSPFDRGMADSYYRRRFDPHYYAKGTYSSEKVTRDQMTPDEVDAYEAGYDYNTSLGDFKDYR